MHSGKTFPGQHGPQQKHTELLDDDELPDDDEPGINWLSRI